MGARHTAAKVTSPRVGEGYPRERLFAELDAGRSRPMVWVCGPGGAGKTHLLASYIEHRGLDALWYHVDHGDTDIASFFYYLGLAAQNISSVRGEGLPLLSPDDARDPGMFAFRFFEELFQRIPRPGLLVFDNLQEVHENAQMYSVLIKAVSRVPEGISIAAVSRNDPPSRFFPMRVARSVKILNWKDVRFTLDEFMGTARLLGCADLCEADIKKMYHSLEGWIAGLVITLEQMRHFGKIRVEVPEGTFNEILDFFVSEIWDAVDPGTREFLLKTACFPFMTVEMARTLTGKPSAGKILSYLNTNNLFTLRFEPGLRYRYHNLFREFLIRQLNEKLAYDEIWWLKKNAAALLLEEGYPEESAELLVEGEDWEGLSSLVWQSAPDLYKQGRIQTIQSWLKRVPVLIRENHPRLLYWQARCALSLDPFEREAIFKRAFDIFEKEGDSCGFLLSWAGRVMTYLHRQKGLENLDHLMQEFQALSPEFESSNDPYVRSQVAASMYVAIIFRNPDQPDAAVWANLVDTLGGADLDLNTRVHFLLGTALRRYFTGRVDGFGEALEKVAEVMGDPARLYPNSRTMYLVLRAIYSWLRYDLEECLAYAREGIDVSERVGGTIWDGLLLGQQVNVWLSRGQPEESKKGLELYRSWLDRLPPLSISYYYQRMAWYSLTRGDLEEALSSALEGASYAQIAGIPNNQSYALVVLAEIYAATGEVDQAQSAILEARQTGVQLGNCIIDFQCALLEARLSFDSGRTEEGNEQLLTALGIGARNNIANWQFLGPADKVKLVTRALAGRMEVDYILDLVRRWNLKPGEDVWNLEAWPWPFRIYTLGRFEVMRNGEPLRFEGKTRSRPLELLKAVIALGGRNVASERLIEALWPDSAGDAAHRTLETNLLRLRRLLGVQKAVELRNGRITLNPHQCWVDAWAFERAFAVDRTDAGPDHPGTAEKAMQLYRGDFLPCSPEAWAVAMRERLANKFIRMADRRAEHLESYGKDQKAIEICLTALDRCPLSENLYRKLMLLYEKKGQNGEAVAVCCRYRRILKAAYGIEPGKMILGLCERLKDDAGRPTTLPLHPYGK